MAARMDDPQHAFDRYLSERWRVQRAFFLATLLVACARRKLRLLENRASTPPSIDDACSRYRQALILEL
ncbi:MAG TPA: hypothetical protein VKA21_00865 [Candidatus Binatia bacterium]|nr:hypothetical protein [Candidatus Binatia bacterium]